MGKGEHAEATGRATAQRQERTWWETASLASTAFAWPLVWVTLVIRSQRFVSLPKWVKRKGAGTLAPNSHKQPSLTVKRTEYYCHYWLLSPFPSRIYSPIPTRKKCIYHQAKTPFSQNIMFSYFYFSFCKKATIKKQIKSKNSLSPKKLSGRTKESFFI